MKTLKVVGPVLLSAGLAFTSVHSFANAESATAVKKIPNYTTGAVAYDTYSEKGFSKKGISKKTWYWETKKVSVKSGYVVDYKTSKKLNAKEDEMDILYHYNLTLKNGKIYQNNKPFSGELKFTLNHTGEKEYYYRAYKGKVVKVGPKLGISFGI